MERLFKSHADKDLVIDCPNISIRQRGVEIPIEVVGSGLIAQSDSGRLTLKLFISAINPNKIRQIEDLQEEVKAGQIFPEHLYFSLEACAINGEVWRCESFIPSLPQYNMNMNCMVVGGSLREIECKHKFEHRSKGDSAIMFFPFLLEHPCNAVTKIETTVADKRAGGSTSVNVATFRFDDSEYTIRGDESWTVITINKEEGAFPQNYIMRICEALAFTFDREFNPAIITSVRSGEASKTLRSYNDGSQRYVSHPPLSTIYQNQNEDIWRIFHRYLVYIESHNKPFLHPLSGHVMSIIRASEASLDAQALSLAVAVEGLMKLSFKDFKKPSQAVLNQVTKLAKLIAESDLDEDFKRRVTGMFGGMKSHRPKDLLHKLVVMGDIRENLVSTWGSLRNAQAHADSQDPEKIAQLLKKCQIVRTLFYELVFIVIGYEGLYTDYSTEDWPNRSNVRAIEK